MKIEDRLARILVLPKNHPDWLDRASGVVGDVSLLQKSFRKMHRRCQRAEAEALREGRRADRMAHQLRRLTHPASR